MDRTDDTTEPVAKRMKLEEHSDEEMELLDPQSFEVPPRRQRRAETVLLSRSSYITLILPNLRDSLTQQAMIRTIESLGVAFVYTVRSETSQRFSHAVMKGSRSWVLVREFDTLEELLQACAEGEIWVLKNNHIPTVFEDQTKITPVPLSPKLFGDQKYRLLPTEADKQAMNSYIANISARDLVPVSLPKMTPSVSVYGFPEKQFLVVGDDKFPVPVELQKHAKQHVYMPKFGFTPSGYSWSVLLAMTIDRLFLLAPDARGQITDSEREEIRATWYKRLASTPQHEECYEHWRLRSSEVLPLDELRIQTVKNPMMSARLKSKLAYLNNRHLNTNITTTETSSSNIPSNLQTNIENNV